MSPWLCCDHATFCGVTMQLCCCTVITSAPSPIFFYKLLHLHHQHRPKNQRTNRGNMERWNLSVQQIRFSSSGDNWPEEYAGWRTIFYNEQSQLEWWRLLNHGQGICLMTMEDALDRLCLFLPCRFSSGGTYRDRQCSRLIPCVILYLEIARQWKCCNLYYYWRMDFIAPIFVAFADIERCTDSTLGDGAAWSVFRSNDYSVGARVDGDRKRLVSLCRVPASNGYDNGFLDLEDILMHVYSLSIELSLTCN